MATKREVTQQTIIGQNVRHYMEDNIAWFGVDLSEEGSQSEGSKGLDKKGNPKIANELVGSTRSYTPVADGRVLLHYIRPMKVAAVRKARALREMDEEDAGNGVDAALAALTAAGIDVSKLAQ